jgi:hypothetical protein
MSYGLNLNLSLTLASVINYDQIVALLADDSRGIIYNYNIFKVQATCLCIMSIQSEKQLLVQP